MTDEKTKNLVCTHEGCTLMFINDDELNTHKKKHDMVLKLGLENKGNVFTSNQTPTPSGILEKGDEVGLFKDLQNVNPFEETFKQAAEKAKKGSLTLLNHEPSGDDTLHTPHVFPHLDVIVDFNEKISEMNKNYKSSSIDSDIIIIEPEEINEHDYAMEMDADKDSNIQKSFSDTTKLVSIMKKKANPNVKQSTVKVKLKKLLENKIDNTDIPHLVRMVKPRLIKPKKIQNNFNIDFSKVTVVHNTNSSNIAAIPKYTLVNVAKNQLTQQSDTEFVLLSEEEKKRQSLERNRAAALRCRERRKVWIKSLEERYDSVCKTNNDLRKEVQDLKSEITHLKTLLLAHKDCPVTKAINEGQVIVYTPSENDKNNSKSSSVKIWPNIEYRELVIKAVEDNANKLMNRSNIFKS